MEAEGAIIKVEEYKPDLQRVRQKLPWDLMSQIVSAFSPTDLPPNARLEMVVILHDQNIPTREFAEYLGLIDRLYGRLTANGLKGYSRRKTGRLLIETIHKSDLEIIFTVWYQVQHALPFIVIMLFLKALPNLIRTASESIKTMAEAYKIMQEGKLVRSQRKIIEQVVETEQSFNQLGENEKKELIEALELLFQLEKNKLAGPAVLAQSQVKDVILRLKAAIL